MAYCIFYTCRGARFIKVKVACVTYLQDRFILYRNNKNIDEEDDYEITS